jgi:hypothetical protein
VLSNNFSSGGDNALSTVQWSDHIWSFGQFMDHDIVSTSESPEPTFPVVISEGTQTATMLLRRLLVNPEAGNATCRSPATFNTPLIDGGAIYGHDADFLKARLLATLHAVCPKIAPAACTYAGTPS